MGTIIAVVTGVALLLGALWYAARKGWTLGNITEAKRDLEDDRRAADEQAARTRDADGAHAGRVGDGGLRIPEPPDPPPG